MARRSRHKKKTTRKTRRIGGSVPVMNGRSSGLGAAEALSLIPPAQPRIAQSRRSGLGAAEDLSLIPQSNNGRSSGFLMLPPPGSGLGTAENGVISNGLSDMFKSWNKLEQDQIDSLVSDLGTIWAKWDNNDPDSPDKIRRSLQHYIKDFDVFNKTVTKQEAKLAKLENDKDILTASILIERKKEEEKRKEIDKSKAGRTRKATAKKANANKSNKNQVMESKLESIQYKIDELNGHLEDTKRKISDVAKKIDAIKKLIKEVETIGSDQAIELYAFLLYAARAYHRTKPKIKSDKCDKYDPTKPYLKEMVVIREGLGGEFVPRTYNVTTGVVTILVSKRDSDSERNYAKKKLIETEVRNPFLFLEKCMKHLNRDDPIYSFLLGYYQRINPEAIDGGVAGGGGGGVAAGGRIVCSFQGGRNFAETSIQQGIDPLQLNTMEVRILLSNQNLATIDQRYNREMRQLYAEAQIGPQGDPRKRPFPVISQLLTKENMKYAFSTEKMRKKWVNGQLPSGENDHGIAMEQGYKIKMGIEANTRSNASKLVSMYCLVSPMSEPLLFTEGLIRTLRDVNRGMNEGFQKNLFYRDVTGRVVNGHKGTTIVHSGGNLIGLLSGLMASFLLPTADPGSFIERIKAKFMKSPRYIDGTFMAAFKGLIQEDPSLLVSLIEATNKVSDIDALVMTDHTDILTLDSGFLQAANLACAKLLRDILVSDVGKESFLPFPPHEPYTGKTFSSFSGLSTEDFREISGRGDVTKAAQTSNRIEIVKILLNRLKIISEGGSDLGEFLDICIGSLENPTFREKLIRFLMGDYYTIDMLIDELEVILAKGEDDKSPIRRKRLDLLRRLKRIPGINDLFRIIGRAISNEDIEAPLHWEGELDPEIDV